MKNNEDVIGDIEEYSYSEIVSLVNSLEKSEAGLTTIDIAFLRNITIDPIVPYLKFLCFQEGFRPNIHMGEYDNVMQEVMDPAGPLYEQQPSLIVVALRLENISEALTTGFVTHSTGEISDESHRVISCFQQVLVELRKNSNAPVLVHNFEVPVYPSLGILDYQGTERQVNTIRKLNLGLLEMVNQFENTYLVDIDLLISEIGYKNFIDNRFWHIGKAPYSREALKALAVEYARFIFALRGRNKKCLVLDCDNTLWGGIVGEDGLGSIKIGATYPGSAYREFQQAILELYEKGVILALCSKNNEEDVIEVLKKHPEMTLRENHFATMKINWEDKVGNLNEIAAELNIGLDTVVFIDDSEFEANLVKRYLPEVKVICLPKDPTGFKDLLVSSGLFDSLTFSQEDRTRGEMYRDEMKRKEVQAEFTSIEDYLRSLEMEVLVGWADDLSVTRIAQLTKRTNQFNLTTRRYSEADIEEFRMSKEAEVIYLSLKDNFGDLGIVGAAILRHLGEHGEIDTFLLSCRAIGRGVEKVLLRECVDLSRCTTEPVVYGPYIRTNKNEQVMDFYQRNGFSIVERTENEIVCGLCLDDPPPAVPDYFKEIRKLGEKNGSRAKGEEDNLGDI